MRGGSLKLVPIDAHMMFVSTLDSLFLRSNTQLSL